MTGQPGGWDYDVVIVGGGMVGLCCACAVASSSRRVAVIESKRPVLEWPQGTTDLRVSAISRATENIFRNLGVWSAIASADPSPFREMRVWDSVGQGAIHFDAADVGEPHLGHIVENRVVQRALWARLGALTNVELRCPASVVHFDVSDDFVTVELAAGHSIKGRLLVAADGVHSPIRQLAGISAVGWSYAQHAVVANVHTEMPHHETAWQRFLPSGPLAFLPLADGRCSVVWSTTPDHAAELLRLNDEQFCVALTDGFGARLGRVLGTGPRAAYPLRLQHATQYVLPRIALVGDAAHAIHPLAGQGANLGFLDVAWLAAILETVNDPGGIAALRRYERARKGDNLRMMAAMDGFKRVFGTASGPLVWLRRLGLGVADNSRILKQGLVRHAMGVNGDLPQLARSPLV